MNIPYNIETHDNLISKTVRDNIWKHIQELQFHGGWDKEDPVQINYSLSSVKNPADWMLYKSIPRKMKMHRSPLSSDEPGLKIASMPIYLLWMQLNKQLGNKYELTGNPEGIYCPHNPPVPEDPNLSAGWRAYINLVYNLQATGGLGYAHRDTPLENNEDNTVTMLYVVNPTWYPSWGAEIKFYPNDDEGVTGDKQQFNTGIGQTRGYNIGWLDQGKVVSPVPGRLIIYDGRCLHSTLPANGPIEIPSVKIAFRARLK